jgi:hypothetical protein
MSTLNGGPGNIVTNGLVLYLDAANYLSYTSGSTTWNDLSGNNNTGSLVNGPTFSSTNAGSIVFDGVNDYANTNYTPSTSSFSINMVYRCTNFQGSWAGLWACEVWDNNTGFLSYFETTSSLVFTRGGGSGTALRAQTTASTLNHYTFTLSGGNTGSIYINGVLQSTRIMAVPSIIEKPILLSTRYSNNGTGITDTRASIIPLFQVYNRALTASEVLQNYNATKARFGL